MKNVFSEVWIRGRIKVESSEWAQNGKTNAHPKRQWWKCNRIIAPTGDILMY